MAAFPIILPISAGVLALMGLGGAGFKPENRIAQGNAALRRAENSSGKRKFARQPRRLAKVDSVVLHQMGFARGNDPDEYDKVTAHFIVRPNGTVAQLHPATRKLFASDAFNSRSVSVEFAGNYPNTRGKCFFPEGKKNKPAFRCAQPTKQQILAGRNLLRYLKKNYGIKHVFAHRQSSGARPNDPGPTIWRNVGVWGEKRLGLSSGGRGFHLAGGRAIDEEWLA